MAPLLDVRDLCVEFQTEEGRVRAVDHVSFQVGRGEIVGLVGESGAGKSLTSEAILRLIKCPPGLVSGQVLYNGVDLLKRSEAEMATIRGDEIAMIFQDARAALKPVFRVGSQVYEAMALHLKASKRSLRHRVLDVFQKVGIPSPENRVQDYPHQFSGGMSQRVMIGTAISCSPSLLIADEPTTALDVTIQAQILYLIRRLAAETQASVLLVSHDLGMISQMCDRVIVMYAGRIVEAAPVQSIFASPSHPYTQGLIASIPRMETDSSRLGAIPGAMPGLLNLPSGCPFHPRCRLMDHTCQDEEPLLHTTHAGHEVACHKV